WTSEGENRLATAHYTGPDNPGSKEKHSVESAAQNGSRAGDDAERSDAEKRRPDPAGGQTGTARVKRGMAEMLKGGVIMDVVTPEQARIAEGAGAVAVMALERVPADIRAQGGVSRMSDPDMIESIISAVTI